MQGVNVASSDLSNYVFSGDLDHTFLQTSYGKNLSFCLKMFDIFLASIEEDMSSLNRSVTDGDFDEVESLAHKIKNNFTWVGLPTMSQYMYDLENVARLKNVDDMQQCMSNLKLSYEDKFQVVRTERERLSNYLSE